MKLKEILSNIEINEWIECFLRGTSNIKEWFEDWFNKAKEDYKTKKTGFPIFLNENGEQIIEKSITFELISKKYLNRDPKGLKKEEFISICKWKTPRPEKKYEANSEELIREITQEVINLTNKKEQMHILINGIKVNKKKKKLKGVGVAVASAILTIIFPEKFCVIDYRAKRALCLLKIKGESKPYNTISFVSYRDYLSSYQLVKNTSAIDLYFKYLEIIRGICKIIGPDITPRMLEVALWKYDKTEDS